jgi:hypothetical protein
MLSVEEASIVAGGCLSFAPVFLICHPISPSRGTEDEEQFPSLVERRHVQRTRLLVLANAVSHLLLSVGHFAHRDQAF